MLKGTAFHEILNLPVYWWKVLRRKAVKFQMEKVPFGKHRHQYFLWLKPEKENRPDKIIIYFHGGGWLFGRPEMFKNNAEVFIKQGYWVFLPTYRRIPQYKFRHIEADVESGILKIMELLKSSLPYEPQIILGGMSAGGHLAAHFYFKNNDLRRFHLSGRVSGLFLCGAPLNLRKMHNSPLLLALAGQRGTRAFQLANPYTYLPAAGVVPPILIIQGTRDGFVPFQSVSTFAERLKEKDAEKVHLEVIQNGTHLDAIQWVHQNGPQRKLLLKWLDKL